MDVNILVMGPRVRARLHQIHVASQHVNKLIQLVNVASGSFVFAATLNFTAPDSDGIVTPAAIDFTVGAEEEGAGVLARLTLEVVGCGTSAL